MDNHLPHKTTIFLDGKTVSWDDAPEARTCAFDILKGWFIKRELFNGESLTQCDITFQEAPEILSQIAEEAFKFQVTYDKE